MHNLKRSALQEVFYLFFVLCSGASLISWGEGASLRLVGHPSNDGVTIKMTTFAPHLFVLGWLKLNLALLLDQLRLA